MAEQGRLFVVGVCKRRGPPPVEILTVQDWEDAVGKHSQADFWLGSLVRALLSDKRPLPVIRLSDA